MDKKIYKSAINSYDNYIKKLDNEIHFINHSAKMDLSSIGLSDADKTAILAYIARKKGTGTIDSGEFENALEYSFASKTQLIEVIQSLYVNTKNYTLKDELKKLLYIVFDKASYDAHIDLSTLRAKELAKNWIFPYNGKVGAYENVIKRLYDRRKFIYNKSLNAQYLPTKPAKASKYGFDDLSLEELQALFIPSNFYKLTEAQIKDLSQALVTAYCKSHNVQSCRVDFKTIPAPSNQVVYGMYQVNDGCIEINQRFAIGIKSAKNAKNPVFPLQLMTTLIHEAQHRVQFASLDNQATNAREELVKQAILHPDCKDYLKSKFSNSTSFASYMSEPDEVDARDSSLQFVESMLSNQHLTNEEDYNKIAAYYNNMCETEQSAEKLAYKDNFKQLFPQIYSPKTYPVNNKKSTMLEIDHAHSHTFAILKSVDASDWANYGLPNEF